MTRDVLQDGEGPPPHRGQDPPREGALAVRRQPDTGSRVETGFFGEGRQRLLGTLEVPARELRGGVVICSPVKAELMKNYRREVRLSEALAARGHAAVRFHYRGTGNSDASEEELTFGGMCADAREAARWLLRRTGVDWLAFFGSRLGAGVAAAAARDWPGAPLAALEPVLDGERYLREVFRYRLISDLKRGEDQMTSQALLEQLQSTGVTEVCGFTIYRSFYDTVRAHTFDAELSDELRPFLLLQIGKAPALRGEYRRLVERLSGTGFSVDTELIRSEVAWWFQGGGAAVPDDDILAAVATWLDSLETPTFRNRPDPAGGAAR